MRPPAAGLVCLPGREAHLDALADRAQRALNASHGLRELLAHLGLAGPVPELRLGEVEDAVEHLVGAAHRYVLPCDGCCRACREAPG